jgi:quinol monooxygenase YgiN
MSAVIIVATAFPAPEHKARVIAAFEAAITRVHGEEPGCELYALHEGPDGRLVMIEKYASQDAVAQHRKGAGLAGLAAALEGKLSAPMDVQVLTPHPAGDPGKGAL